MAQPANGVLYVESFTATGNPGEYTFENGLFNNQNDAEGLGAYVLDTSFAIFTPVVDPNIFAPVLGVVNRYKFTQITVIDNLRVSGTILFDEPDEVSYIPGTMVFCLVSKVTPNLKLAPPPLDDIYTDLIKGGTIGAIINDLINVLDKVSGSGPSVVKNPPAYLLVNTNGQTQYTLPFAVDDVLSCYLSVNGVIYHPGADNDFTVNGTTLMWVNSEYELNPLDTVVFHY